MPNHVRGHCTLAAIGLLIIINNPRRTAVAKPSEAKAAVYVLWGR